MQSSATEMEVMKIFIKEQFYSLKKSISEINNNTDATDNSITETTIQFNFNSIYFKERFKL